MSIIQKWNSISLVKRIVCGLIIGAILGLLIPQVKVIGVLVLVCWCSEGCSTYSGILPGYRSSGLRSGGRAAEQWAV